MNRVLLSGNEAVAHGAWEAGACVGVGYPGTPSTQALEHFATLPGVYAEWAPNEKVALEVAAGVSLAGKRSLVTMKHVGLNVAADPLFTLAYTGVGGGLVVFVADDPGMHSSQNEQDSHNYGPFARVPVLDPADSAEARAFTIQAFGLSERFDLPVLVRSTVRVSHAKSLVELGERVEPPAPAPYATDVAKWVMMPHMARGRRRDLDDRISRLSEFAETSELNRVEMRDPSLGVVCAGVVYYHVREALPDASVFKLGMTFPLPESRLKEFADSVDRVVVVEEADTYLARSLRALGISTTPVPLPPNGELTPGAIRLALGHEPPATRVRADDVPPRPPLMCPGCPHRPVFAVLRKLKAVVTGDIGCYTLGALAPLSAMDTCVCMGASVGMAHGVGLAGGVGDRPVCAVIGDSTFAHTGIPGLLNTAYNRGSGTVVILDNRTTAMTGHQGNPVSGVTLQGRPSRELDLATLARALGIDHVAVVDPHDFAATEAALRRAFDEPDLSVVIFKAPCALLVRDKGEPYAVDEELCTACQACIRLGCPAIGRDEITHKAFIDVSLCVGCGQCVQVCRFGAIVHTGPACDLGGP